MRHYFGFLLLLASVVGCNNSPTKPAPAAEKPKVESELAFTNLSKAAYVRLDIQTQKLMVAEEQERLALTGWIMAKPGHEVTMTAPTAGYVHFKSQKAPIAGKPVEKKQELLELEPVHSPVEKIQIAALERSIKSDLVKAQTTLVNAEREFKRIAELFKQNLKSKQEYEQAEKAIDHAKEEIAGATEKLTFFKTPAIPMFAPQAGTILTLHVGPGQYVPASAPLLTIIDLDPVWLRVPVPEIDLPRVNLDANVEILLRVVDKDGKEKQVFPLAKPRGRVAQVDPLKHTAELWYELEKNTDTLRLVKDQMVPVKIPVGPKEKRPVIPYSAVVFDAHGHSWIYLERPAKDDKHRFERRPIELITAVKDGLMIRSDLKDGDLIVTKGAAILFSRDFHKTPVPEDD